MPGLLSLPELGDNIDYRPYPDFVNKLLDDPEAVNRFRQLKQNYHTLSRINGGQIGPEVGGLLSEMGLFKKPIKDGRLSLNVNWRNPYIGMTYRF